jgi:hypothetical protein
MRSPGPAGWDSPRPADAPRDAPEARDPYSRHERNLLPSPICRNHRELQRTRPDLPRSPASIALCLDQAGAVGAL